MSGSIEEYIQNPIKRHIIASLMKFKKLKYSELMPEDVDNVLFNYHLQHLVKNGLLLKEENLYSFTPDGWVETSHVTYEGLYVQKFVCRLRMYVFDGDKVLLHKRMFGPWEGDTTSIWGKLLYGELLSETVSKQLKNETGLSADFKNIGTIRTLFVTPEKDILDDSIYFVCIADKFSGELKSEDSIGNELGWFSLDEAIKLESANKGSGDKTVELLKRFKDKNFDPFVFEEMLTAETL